jgi:hypothetical protein
LENGSLGLLSSTAKGGLKLFSEPCMLTYVSNQSKITSVGRRNRELGVLEEEQKEELGGRQP